MSLIGLFGANCSGKDTIIKKAQELDPSIIFVRSSKVFMQAMGYSVDPLSAGNPPREWYLALEALPQFELDFIADIYFPTYLKNLKKQGSKIFATFHLVLLKRDAEGKLLLCREKPREEYKNILDGAVYLRADLDSIWMRRNTDIKRDRGSFTIEEVALQLNSSDEEWNKLTKQFDGYLPYITLDNSNALNPCDKDKKLMETAQQLIKFIDAVNMFHSKKQQSPRI